MKMKPASLLLAVPLALALSGCSTWSTSSVKQSDAQKQIAAEQTAPAEILLTEEDITDRAYVSLGDITVNVNKTTVFNKNPTKEQVDEKLKEKASKMGADAVVFVRYGEGGIGFFSWGNLEGKGRAVKFEN